MNFMRRILPAGVLAIAGVQYLMLLAFGGFLLWIGWDLFKVLWRFIYGLVSLFG